MNQQLSLFTASSSDSLDPIWPAEIAPEICAVAAVLPRGIHLGTSSWSFPTWRGLVYAETYDESRLAHEGLRAYAQHPLLRSVGIDRTYYAPIQASDFAHYASQVPEGFRFLVKAPAQCTSPWLRHDAVDARANPHFLDANFACESFVIPAQAGLGEKLGPLVFQFPPLSGWSRRAAQFAERLRDFLRRLPMGPLYAVELRDSSLLGDPYVQALLDTGARHCIGLHPRQPAIREQARLLERLPPGPLVVRWNLRSGAAYEEARRRYFPFTELVEEDLPTRVALARLCLSAAAAGQPAFVIANNKAEGSAPLTLIKLATLIADEQREQSAAS